MVKPWVARDEELCTSSVAWCDCCGRRVGVRLRLGLPLRKKRVQAHERAQ